MAIHILTVDDDALLRRSLAFTLEQAGYRVSTAASAEDALALIELDPPDLILLDIGLPGMDGLEAIRRLQARLNAPIIFVTARRRELEQVLGLELGADDYITKPFDSDVLLARIKAVLRRYRRGENGEFSQNARFSRPATLTVGDLVVDPGAHAVTVAGRDVSLSPREFDLLYALAQQAGNVVTADELLSRVWGAEFEGESQVLYVHMRRLREKIEDDPNNPQRIVTVRGVGYKLNFGE
jgi:DNA-binding response OmpR family regulator